MIIDKFTKYLNITLFGGLVVIIVILIILDINPSGKRVVLHSAIKPNGLIDGPRPADRLLGTSGEGENKVWEMGIDPVYFELYIPRLYQQIIFELIVDPDEQELIELGGLGSSQGWQISLKPGLNTYFDNLLLHCQTVENLSVCSQADDNKNYFSLAELIQNNSDKQFLTYHFNTDILGVSSTAWNKDITIQPNDLIFTNYKKPEKLDNNFYRLVAIFKPEELFLAGHIYTFVVSAPDLKINNQVLKIKAANFYLEKEPLTLANLPDKAKRFWQRVLAKF